MRAARVKNGHFGVKFEAKHGQKGVHAHVHDVHNKFELERERRCGHKFHDTAVQRRGANVTWDRT